MKHTVFLTILTSILFSSCNFDKKEKNEDREILVEMNNDTIYSDELNSIIKQELFDELNRIYEIKRKALEQLVNIKILQQEAKKQNLSYQQYIDCYTNNLINQFGIDSLLNRYNIKSITEFHGTSIYNIAPSSPTGKISRIFHLKGAIIDNLVDSLRKKQKIAQYLYPPQSPIINLKNLDTHYRGNLQSKTSVTIISDFDCEACIKSHSLYNTIYQEYKDKVKFGYTHFSTIPTFAQIASDAAGQQSKFWEFHDSLYAHKGYIDSTAVYRIAHNLSMDIKKFKQDIEDNAGKKTIENTINQLVLSGVYATPTIIVNRRLIINSNSKKEICHLIDEELSK